MIAYARVIVDQSLPRVVPRMVKVAHICEKKMNDMHFAILIALMQGSISFFDVVARLLPAETDEHRADSEDGLLDPPPAYSPHPHGSLHQFAKCPNAHHFNNNYPDSPDMDYPCHLASTLATAGNTQSERRDHQASPTTSRWSGPFYDPAKPFPQFFCRVSWDGRYHQHYYSRGPPPRWLKEQV